MTKVRDKKGFTLIEIILVIAIVGIVIQLSYSIFFSGTKSFSIGRDKGLSQEDFRIIQESLLRELRYARDLDMEEPDLLLYYCLRLKEHEDESFSLIKTEFNRGSKTNTPIATKFKEIEIISERGKLNVDIRLLEEKEKKSFTILLENNLGFSKDIDLSSQDLSEFTLYYVFPEDMEEEP